MDLKLKDKVVMITGSTGGVGEALVRAHHGLAGHDGRRSGGSGTLKIQHRSPIFIGGRYFYIPESQYHIIFLYNHKFL